MHSSWTSQRRLETLHKRYLKYSVKCILCLEFSHECPNSCNTKLANGGDDRGCQIFELYFVSGSSQYLLFFLLITLGFPGEIDKTLFLA